MKYIFRFFLCFLVILCSVPVMCICLLHSLIHWDGRAFEFIAITLDYVIELFLLNKKH